MRIKQLHPALIIPTKATNESGAYDLFMPEAGIANGQTKFFKLGFAAAVPPGHVALLLPRSGTGAKFGVELNNTCGVIDADYRGEWMAAIRTKDCTEFQWNAGDRLLQFLIVPVAHVSIEVVEELDSTARGKGGFGSSGK